MAASEFSELTNCRYVSVLPKCISLAILVSKAPTGEDFIQRVTLLEKIEKGWMKGCVILIECVTPADSGSDDNDDAVDLNDSSRLDAELSRVEVLPSNARLPDELRIKEEEVASDFEENPKQEVNGVSEEDTMKSKEEQYFQNSLREDTAAQLRQKRRKDLPSIKPRASEKQKRKFRQTTGKSGSEISSQNSCKRKSKIDSENAGKRKRGTNLQNSGKRRSELSAIASFEAVRSDIKEDEAVEKPENDKEFEEMAEGVSKQQHKIGEANDDREEISEDGFSDLRSKNDSTEEDLENLSEKHQRGDVTESVLPPCRKRKYKPRRESAMKGEKKKKLASKQKTIEDDADDACKSKKRKTTAKKVGIIYESDGEDSEIASSSQDLVQRNASTSFPCRRCEMTFKNFPRMRKHMIETHGGFKDVDIGCPDGLFPCPQCGLKLRNYYQLKRHTQKVHEKKDDGSEFRFMCCYCGAKMMTHYQYKKHMLKVHDFRIQRAVRNDDEIRENADIESKVSAGEKLQFTYKRNLTCPMCPEVFCQKRALDKHMRVHVGVDAEEKLFVCEICGKTLRSKTIHTEHMKIHRGDRRHACPVCGKSFFQSHDLTDHMTTHTGHRPHVCNICGSGFIRSTRLNYHMRKHTGERPFSCPVCDRSFALSRQLKLHLAMHSDARPFLCEVCAIGFKRKSGLNRHRRMHLVARPYSCGLCPRQFNQVCNLKTHMRTHTGEKPYVCLECGRKFAHGPTLKQHMESHHTSPNGGDRAQN